MGKGLGLGLGGNDIFKLTQILIVFIKTILPVDPIIDPIYSIVEEVMERGGGQEHTWDGD